MPYDPKSAPTSGAYNIYYRLELACVIWRFKKNYYLVDCCAGAKLLSESINKFKLYNSFSKPASPAQIAHFVLQAMPICYIS